MERPVTYLIIVTLLLGALQLAWSLEFTQATPYLISLGVPKPVLSLVWLAGPLSGTIGQPIVGMLSDGSSSQFGRRRPFIIMGSLLTVSCLLGLSHTRVVWIACLIIYALDFSIQIIQASARALIADVIDYEQQEHANAWAGRMIASFNIVGFFLSSFDLTRIGNGLTQFQVLAIVVSIVVVTVTFACCFCIKESTVSAEEPKPISWSSLKGSWQEMDPKIRLVCWIEGFAWLGYFPLLFYTTAYVGGLYVAEMGPFEGPVPEWVINEGTRRGSMALLSNGIVSLLTVTAGPHILWMVDIVSIWRWSHVIFVVGALSTIFITGSLQAVVLFGVLGIPWGCATWVPFVLINKNVSDDAGVVLGIHNVFVCVPQMLSSLISALVFYLFKDGMRWVFSILGVFTVFAWALTGYII